MRTGSVKGTTRRASRSPFPGWVPKSVKRESGLVPAHIRVLGTHLSKDERRDIRKKLGKKLGKFGRMIQRVSLRVMDANGPRGGLDQVCRLKVVLNRLPSIVAEAQDAVLGTAIQKALAAAERAVRRTVQRRRMKPVKRAARPRTAVA
ncbi:MAG TPA: HPF/RaiA family ribosome-associated protein [Nitrospira sp.]|nr:HPF/RaiA family ribosome-associated protein [Nitrospira sp.]